MVHTPSAEVEQRDERQLPRPRAAETPRRARLKNVGEVAALLVLIAVFAALNPDSFPTVKNLQTILMQAALPLIVGVGATMVILMGSIDLSVEGVMGASGMTFVLLSANSRNGIDLGPAAYVIAIAIGVGLGLLTGLVHTRLKVPTFITTLGVWYVGYGIATILFGQDAIPFLTSESATRWTSNTTAGLPHGFLVAALVVAVGVAITRSTRLGRFTYAIGNNEAIARDNGVPVARYKVYVFLLAGGCSALAGVLGSLQLGAGATTVGVGTLFLTIAAVVVGGTALGGGRGGVLRTTVGVFILTVLNNGLVLSGVSANIQSAVSGAILILAIVAVAWPQRSRLRIAK